MVNKKRRKKVKERDTRSEEKKGEEAKEMRDAERKGGQMKKERKAETMTTDVENAGTLEFH